jgi:hypothetical protein
MGMCVEMAGVVIFGVRFVAEKSLRHGMGRDLGWGSFGLGGYLYG